MEKEINQFSWVDYLVFAIFLLVSALVGVLFGFLDRKKMSSKNFLLGGGNLPWYAVAFSMQASFLSAIFILSLPVEIYNWGTMYYFIWVSYFIAMPFSAHFFLAIYYKLNITSAYEYLEMRFDKLVRTICAITFCIQILLYMSVVLYTPALALSQVTGLSVLMSVIACGLICTFYTFLGGMKATVWNDFVQIIVIVFTLLLVIIIGLINAGGFSNVWQSNKNGGRIIFNDFRVNPTIRTTFWTQSVGGTFIMLSQYASSQTTIQKFLSVKTLKEAQRSIYLNVLTSVILITMVCFIGLLTYDFYEGCDPLMNGQIEKKDQIVPLYVMEIMGHLNGLPGLFIAAVFSAALSSISGSLNALSAVTLTDFMQPLFKMRKEKDMDERTKAIISRSLILIYGIIVTVLGFAAQFFGDVVIQMAFSIFGFVGGPLTCVIALGIFFPFCNSWGALCGLIASLGVSSWVAVGAIISKVTTPLLPLSTDKCPASNFTTALPTTSAIPMSSDDDILVVYKVSYMYYGLIAMVVCFSVGIIVSLITGRTKEVDARLCVDWYSWFPSKMASFLQCGVNHFQPEEEEEVIANQKALDKINSRNELNLYVMDDVLGVEDAVKEASSSPNKTNKIDFQIDSYWDITSVVNDAAHVTVVKASMTKGVANAGFDSEDTYF